MNCGKTVKPERDVRAGRMTDPFEAYETKARNLAAKPLQMQQPLNRLFNVRLLRPGTAARF